MKFRTTVLALAAAIVWAAPLAAQETGALPATVSLSDVLTLLAERSPRTIADRASIAVAAADRLSARALPNPTASYGATHLVSGLSTGAVTQHQFGMEQPLLLFHQRQARTAVADAGVHVEEANAAAAFADRRSAVRQTFASLLARQQQLAVVQEGLTDLERIQQLVRGRAAAGDRSAYDVMRVETEVQSLNAVALSVSADVEGLARELAVLVGLPGWSPRATGELRIGTVTENAGELWDAAQQRLPSLAALRQQQSASRSNLFLAGRERMPVPAISAGGQTTRDVNGTSAFIGLSIPLPLFDRSQGALARASAQVSAADLKLVASAAEARAELDRATSVLRLRRAALESFDATVANRTPALRQMAEDAYREGAADILELLDANRTLREIRLTRVQQVEDIAVAEEQTRAAAGLDEPTP